MKKQNKRITLAVGIILVLILLVPLSYAAYTSVTSARRVVSTANLEDALFSSNYLSLLPQSDMEKNNATSKEYAYKNIPISYTTGTVNQAVYVSVCNYAQGYPGVWSKENIKYRIEFSLVDLKDHKEIKNDATYTRASGETVSGRDILGKFKVSEGIVTSGNDIIPIIPHIYNGKTLISNDNVAQDMYTVFFDTTYADIVGVKIEVFTETDSPAYSGYGLGGVLALSGYTAEVATGWNGEIQEGTGDSKNYTGLNYEVSGAGAGTVTVRWNEKKFAISEIFVEDMQNYIIENSKTENSISFRVGEENQDDSFFIQFYRVSQPDSGEDWKALTKDFLCNFVKKE